MYSTAALSENHGPLPTAGELSDDYMFLMESSLLAFVGSNLSIEDTRRGTACPTCQYALCTSNVGAAVLSELGTLLDALVLFPRPRWRLSALCAFALMCLSRSMHL